MSDSQEIYQEAKELHSNKEVRYMLHLVQVGVEYVHVCVVNCVFKHLISIVTHNSISYGYQKRIEVLKYTIDNNLTFKLSITGY